MFFFAHVLTYNNHGTVEIGYLQDDCFLMFSLYSTIICNRCDFVIIVVCV